MPPARKLVILHVSPWSERARWALDHHGLAYELAHHFPILGERSLRRMVGPDKPRATVPVLIAGSEVLSESWDIAKYADREGAGTKLVPPEHEATIKAWVDRADEASLACRARVLAATAASPVALDENSPSFVPSALRPLLRPVARRVTMAFVRKYELKLDDGSSQTDTIRKALLAVRAALSGQRYLLGFFSYADIAFATVIQGISPVADRFIKLGPATRAAWTRSDLATEFEDLVAWRDGLYEGQRDARASAA
jgi:glutathione S-transferase